ncbi:hypothetical protein KRR38_06075 [Novosphingobium sp. G106]|uniref:hypothetical protein n=1 Tax=Novosphingobium sp. G106 TaxID=2849500 RepID=UPI001C2DA6B1|nr:hypothetical protein [Novosphingobium sp. G106]MBV1687251.1 hypothetical protein [Novosphingobium sp. G106]
MKKSRTQRRSHRTSNPSVICLSPPKPPATAPRREPEVERALRLPNTEEPLVIDPALESDLEVECYATRQMRRRAKRAEAKAARRRGVPTIPETVTETVEEAADSRAAQHEEPTAASIEPIAEMIERIGETPIDTSVDSLAEALAKVRAEVAPAEAPEPVAEPALTVDPVPIEAAETAPLPSSRALTKQPSGVLARIFSGWWRGSTKLERRDPDALTEQMLVLRTELALVQMRLDRMIKAASS